MTSSRVQWATPPQVQAPPRMPPAPSSGRRSEAGAAGAGGLQGGGLGGLGRVAAAGRRSRSWRTTRGVTTSRWGAARKPFTAAVHAEADTLVLCFAFSALAGCRHAPQGDVSDVPIDPAAPPALKSQGADLAELLETAGVFPCPCRLSPSHGAHNSAPHTAVGTFFGRRTLRGAFKLDWEDDDVQHWLGDTHLDAAALPGDDDVASLLAWDVDAVALALAGVPLHELLGIPEDRCREAAVSYAKDTATFVAAMQAAQRRAQPGSGGQGSGQEAVSQGDGAAIAPPVETPRADAPQRPPSAAAPVAPTSASRASTSPPPPPLPSPGVALPPPVVPPALQALPPVDDGEDDDFLNEMLGKK